MPDVTPRFKEPKPAKTPKPTRLRPRAKRTGTRPTEPWSTDADYEVACQIVDARSGGVCEHCGKERGTNHHHIAGRGFAGCHHPLLIKLLCGQGNTSGCHRLAHSVSMATGRALGLRLPWGTRAEELL